jgi:hypothetical protein
MASTLSSKHRQLDDIIAGHGFHRLPCLSPCAQSTGDHEHLESFFLQQMRHPGARGFACSSAVEINLPLLGKVLDLLLETIGLDANRSGNALGVGIVISVAAHIGNQDAVGSG